MYAVGDVIELEVDRLAPGGGKGISRTKEGMAVFTQFVAPGDLIKARLTKVKKRFAEAELVEIVKPSNLRVDPICPVFTECGGCQWQMISYEEQLKQKNEFLNYEFDKINYKQNINLVPSPDEFRYRNRIQVHQKGSKLGFLKKKTHDLVEIKDCYIAEEEITVEFKELIKEPKNERIEIARDSKGLVHKITGKKPANLNLFSQVNTKQNSNLLEYIESEIKELKLRNILDLYCGNGNITFPVKTLFPEANVIGVELSKASVKQAKGKNTGIKFVASDVLNFLKDPENERSYELVVLDPPREGAGEAVMAEVLRSSPKSVLYVSCDLATLMRDLRVLLERYSIESVRGFDMFPQTYHLETVVRLNKKR